MKTKAVYISVSLLVAYSIFSYFAPEYIVDNVLRLHKTREQSQVVYEELINVTKASFAAIQSLKEGKWIEVE